MLDISLILLPLTCPLPSLAHFYKIDMKKHDLNSSPWPIFRAECGNIQASSTLDCSTVCLNLFEHMMTGFPMKNVSI